MPAVATAARNASTCAGAIAGSRHWLGVLVKIWMAVAPIVAPRAGAFATPPWVETCAPSRSSGRVFPPPPSPPRQLREGQPRDQRHEPHASRPALLDAAGRPPEDDQLLGGEVTDRNHQPAAEGQLLRERRRSLRNGCGGESAVERGGLDPAFGPGPPTGTA